MLEAIEAARLAVTAVTDLAKGAFNAKVDAEVQAARYEVQGKLLELQGHLLEAVQERHMLVNELADARRELKVAQESRQKLDEYQLDDVGEGVLVHRFTGTGLEHFACPNCYSDGKVAVLQVSRTGRSQHRYVCTACRQFVRCVGPDDPLDYSGLN